MKSPEKSGGGRKRLTDEEREERRVARNAKKREKYAAAKEDQFMRERTYIPEDSRKLLAEVFAARRKLSGMLSAKAEWIISSWKEGQPKIGWQNDAREIIAAAGGET